MEIKFNEKFYLFIYRYSKKIPLEHRLKIKNAVLEAHEYGEIGGYGGKMSHYISVEDKDYNILRNVIKLLNNN